MDLTRPSPDRRALLRGMLPSDPDVKARCQRLAWREVGRWLRDTDFGEPHGWRFVEPEPGRPSLWRRVMAWWGR